MFFKHKQPDTQLRQLDEQLHSFKQKFSAVSQRLDSLNEATRQLDNNINQKITNLDSGIHQQLSGFHSIIQKHDMVLEDLLDEWEERKSDAQAVQDRFAQMEQNETQLLALIEASQEQFWSLKRFAESNQDTALSTQVALIEKSLERSRLVCGIHLIQECGVDVDYSLHEIVEAIDTDDPTLDKKIADIYRCGYIYKGTVKKKAKAAAYRLIKQKEHE